MTSQALELKSGDEMPHLPYAPHVAPLDDADRVRHAPDCHLLLIDAVGTVTARCSCWWTGGPRLDGQRVGIIGHYAASSVAAATALLTHACARLQRAGCVRAVGPMDGSTWRSYRLVTERGSARPFFLEPWTPDSWLEQWHSAGFAPVAQYTSSINDDLSREDPRVPHALARLDAAGVTIRCLDPTDAERDLRRIFALASESFERNYLFSPISQAEFLEQNRRLLPSVDPRLILIAEHDECRVSREATWAGEAALCGFLFAVPDVLGPRCGLPLDTVIIKTVAVRRGPVYAGLGAVLVARAHRTARDLGFRRAIHALMYDGNPSRNISRRFASPMRRYALLGRNLSWGTGELGTGELATSNFQLPNGNWKLETGN